MRGLIKPSQPALMETWWWKKIVHFCLSPPVLLGRCLDSRWGLLMLGGTGGTSGCGDTAVGSLPAPSPMQWDPPPATVLSPFLFRKRVSHGTPIPELMWGSSLPSHISITHDGTRIWSGAVSRSCMPKS